MVHERTFVSILHERATKTPNKVALRIAPRGGSSKNLTFGDLHRQACAVAARLRTLGVDTGDRVMIMLPTSFEFVWCYYGILIAGGIPVPVYPATSTKRLHSYLDTLRHILKNVDPRVVLVPDGFDQIGADGLGEVASFLPRLKTFSQLMETAEPSDQFFPPSHTASSTALIQFSSGSTGKPRGICLSNSNLISNLDAIGDTLSLTASDVIGVWLPLYHDMGLIGALLGGLVVGWEVVLMSPMDFIARPSSWLRLLSNYGVTVTAAPQAAYSLVVRRVDDDELQGINLGRLRTMLVGAEPLIHEDLHRFCQKLAPFGLQPGAVFGCYGLAENTLAVSFERPSSDGPRSIEVSESTLAEQGAVELPRSRGDRMIVMSSGNPIANTRVRIVDRNGRDIGSNRVGEIQVQGSSTCIGIFGRPDLTEELFSGPWLRTGDLGFMRDGRLYVTGRLKDVIIVAGHNYYPSDLEQAVSGFKGLRPGRIVAIGLSNRSRGTEEVVIVAETTARENELPTIARAVRHALGTKFGVMPADVIFVPKGEIPITPSGKLRRRAVREACAAGTIQRYAPKRDGACIPCAPSSGASLGTDEARHTRLAEAK